MRQVTYLDIGSMEQLKEKPHISYPQISISIKAEQDQMKFFRNPPTLPLTYTFGKGDQINTQQIPVSGPDEQMKKLKNQDFSFYMLQNKTADQIMQFVKLKTYEMGLDQKRIQKILKEVIDKFEIKGDDPASQFIQEVLNIYYQNNSSSQNQLSNKKNKFGRQNTPNRKNSKDGSSHHQIRLKIPSQYLRSTETQQDTAAFMKIPLGLSSHISESNRQFRLRGMNINENQLIMCNICCEEWFNSQFFRISKQCTHIFCITCSQNYLISKIQSSDVFCIKCPQDDCNIYFYDHEIALAINQDHYYVRKYMSIKKLKAINTNPKTRWCINPKCNNYIRIESVNGLTNAYPQLQKCDDKVFSTCDACQTKFCSECCYPAHLGVNCEQNYELLYSKIKKQNDKQPCNFLTKLFYDIFGYLLQFFLYLFLYIIYIVICIPFSLVYLNYMYTNYRQDKNIKQNILIIFISNIIMYPLILLMLLTVGIKLYFIPKVKNILIFLKIVKK